MNPRLPTPRNPLRNTPRVLSIAGTDPTGGAGIHADLKSIAANGGYGMAVVTALVAQNTRGVRSVHTPPVDFLRDQLTAVSDDVTIDAVKIGMLADEAVIGVVREWLAECRPALVVLDPVMIATSGDRLLQPSAERALRELIPLVHLVTPNIAELAVLVSEPVAVTWAEALAQGRRLSDQTGVTVLVKGGHFDGIESPDALVNTHGLLSTSVVEISTPRVATVNTHGTGCSLSAAMATVQARTGNWEATLTEVKAWLQNALVHADELEVGEGNGPINHFQHLFAGRAAPESLPTVVPTFTESLWRDIELIRSQIFELDFILALGDGSLSEHEFRYYLAQDALYLETFSGLLERASALAPTAPASEFFARSAQDCREVEQELHRRWLSIGTTIPASVDAAGPITAAYQAHLTAAGEGGDYAVLVAALLPCFWLYSAVGDRLHADYLRRPPLHASLQATGARHPYADWLETYADEGFADATRRAIQFTEDAAVGATNAQRLAMRQAFTVSARHELQFFDAPRQHSVVS